MAESADLWTEYWRTGPIAACTEQFPQEVGREIGRHWEAAFAALPHRARILDIATGNGAVLALARKVAGPTKTFTAIGVDKADIDPARRAGPGPMRFFSVDFRGGVDAEALPFPDRTFDLVTSQFGIEYADFTAALEQACRVCRGALRILVHARDSVVVRQNAAQTEQALWLERDLAVFDAVRAYIRMPNAESTDRLRHAAAELRARAAEIENPDMLRRIGADFGRLLRIAPHYNRSEAEAMIDGMQKRVRDHAARMHALAVAARSKQDMQDAARLVRARAFADARVDAQRQRGSGRLVAWWLRADRL